MPHTLVTGANSFVAAEVIDALIKHGHSVTGTVRRTAAGEEVLAEHPEWKEKLDFVEIPDYATPGVFDYVFKSKEIDYVAHVAAPMLDNPANTDFDEHYLRPSVEGNLSLLRSANQYAKSLKHISMIGSINAITTGADLATRTLTNSDWNNITLEDARTSKNPYIYYCSSKKEAEKAVWRFVDDVKPAFSITVFLPALIFGPPLQPVHRNSSDGKVKLNFSVDVFHSLWDGRNAAAIPDTIFPSYIDVRDLAEALVRALTAGPAVDNKRFLLGGMPLTFTAMVRALAALVAKGELPAIVGADGKLAKESGEDQRTVVPKIEAAEGNEALGMQFRSLEETVRDMTLRILELENRKA